MTDARTRTASLARFVAMRLEAMKIMQAAEKLPGLPAQHRVQAAAAYKLCALRLHRVIGQADQLDAQEMASDLLAIARVIDPLIAAIGDEAKSEFGIDEKQMECFRDQLREALEGNATFVIEQAAQARFGEERGRGDFEEHGTLNKTQQGV